MEPTDQELLSLLKAGDSSALGFFFDRYSSRVLGLLVKFVGRLEDAEDLLQETFCEAWRRAASYDPSRSRFDSWLLLIARSRALDYLRSRRPAADWTAVLEPATDHDLTGELELVEDSDRLREALVLLPHEQRQAIELAFFAGLTHEQIAGKLGAPLGTIKSRVRLGMNRLRDYLRGRTDSERAL
jgi:RNA polymerase sigma-70 factor (ECF subfamily)